jgi:hypothetical protein
MPASAYEGEAAVLPSSLDRLLLADAVEKVVFHR